MKNQILGTIAIGMIALSSFTWLKENYQVDVKASSLEWNGKKLTGEHHGTIMVSSGEVQVENDNIVGGKLEIDMNSIANKDVTDKEWSAKLDGHLKGADFFDAQKFPKATFIITSVTPIKDAKKDGYTHTVKGNLTIKDKTNELVFDAVVKSSNGAVVCSGTAVIDRSKYDVKYGSKAFFPEIGDKVIYDEFTIKFNILAKK